MNTGTGQLISPEELMGLPAEQKSKYVEVKRDLTAKEKADKQIAMYAPCGCGSGKKFKFCCRQRRKQ